MQMSQQLQLQPIPVGPITSFADDRPPWARQPGEPDRAWDAFVLYRNMPPHERSVSAAHVRTGKTYHGGSSWSTWSTHWRWRDRCMEFDAYLDAQTMQELVYRRKRVLVDAARLGGMMRDKAADAVKVLHTTTTVMVDGEPVIHSALSASEIVRLAQAGLTIERTALGLESAQAPIGIGAVQLNVTVNHQTQSDDDELIRRAQNVIEAKAVMLNGNVIGPGQAGADRTAE